MVTKKGGRHTRKKIRILSEAFQEIESYFALLGFASHDDRTVEEAPDSAIEDASEDGPENEEEGPDDSDGLYESAEYDREELEVAIDVFISELVDEGVIRKVNLGERPPTLEAVFEDVFGEKHEIVDLVRSFDNNVKGYFGAINREDMDLAFSDLVAIRVILDKYVGDNCEN